MSVSISGDGSLTGIDQGLNVVGVLTASGGFSGNLTGTVNSSGIATFTSGIVVSAGTTAAPSISPTGDSNTGIFFPSADTIAFGEGGVEALRVNSSGNVGINSTIPSDLLDVGGTGSFGIGRADSNNYNIRVRAGTSGLSRFIAADTSDAGYLDYDHSSDSWIARTAGTERVRIDSSGRVLTPYQPAFKAYGGTFSPGSVISFTNTSVNVGSHYSTSTGRFTAPVSGNYLITASMFVSTTGSTQINIRKNNSTGTLELKANTNEGAYNAISGSCVVTLSVGDYITMFADSGSVLMGEQFTFLSGYLIG